MDPQRLIKMANQIAAFFEVMPDRAQAAAEVAGHIRRTWDPRMRRALFAHLAADGEADLSPLAREAVVAHRTLLEPGS